MKEPVFRWGNFALEALVIAAVMWSTLALGAAWGWGLAVTFALLSATFCLWVGMRLLAGDLPHRKPPEGGIKDPASKTSESAERPLAPALRIRSRMACIVVAALGAYVILQTLPLPVPLVRLLSPLRVAHEQRFREALGEPLPRVLPLTVDRHASQRALNVVALAVMAFTAGAYLSTSRTRVRRVMRILVVLALVEALYGLAENLSGHAYILWIPVGGDVARGTFFNRNHFAATLALFLPVMIGWFYYRVAAAKSRHDQTHMLPATSWDILQSRQALWLIPPAVLVTAIIQSQSRGGFSSMLLAAALMFAIGARSKAARTVSWLGIPLALAMFAYGINSDYQDVLDRFGQLTRSSSADSRTIIWKDSLGILRDYSLFGVGLGNFPRVYMQYASVSTLVYPYMAHNEWLEGLVTLGGLGMGLVVIALVGFFVRAFLQIRHAGTDYPWMLGCWCGLVGLAFHSFAEFNLHIPSITVTAALMAGILLGTHVATHSRGKSHDSEKHGSHHGHRSPPSSSGPRLPAEPSRRPAATGPLSGAQPEHVASPEESVILS